MENVKDAAAAATAAARAGSGNVQVQREVRKIFPVNVRARAAASFVPDLRARE